MNDTYQIIKRLRVYSLLFVFTIFLVPSLLLATSSEKFAVLNVLRVFGMVEAISSTNVSNMKSISEKNLEVEKKAGRNILNISIPKVPKAVELNISRDTSTVDSDRSIKFSKRVPPNYISSSERYGEGGKGSTLSHSNGMVGDVDKGRISAYLRGNLLDVKVAKDKLKNAGFEILADVALDKDKKLVSIVFTSKDLKALASKTDRGYIGTLRLLIDTKNRQISITNPLYLAKAFMQDSFDDKIPKKTLVALNNEFTKLENSIDKLKFQLLPKYQFMKGMPFFQDKVIVASGDNLLKKIKDKKRVAFIVKLNNGSFLVGIKLAKHTSEFTKKIGTRNAGMLPYPLLIENGEAKILEPKYYLSLMYPQLTMEEFMTIATVPDEIINECKRLFN